MTREETKEKITLLRAINKDLQKQFLRWKRIVVFANVMSIVTVLIIFKRVGIF